MYIGPVCVKFKQDIIENGDSAKLILYTNESSSRGIVVSNLWEKNTIGYDYDYDMWIAVAVDAELTTFQTRVFVIY